jgi:hypothetical protein
MARFTSHFESPAGGGGALTPERIAQSRIELDQARLLVPHAV